MWRIYLYIRISVVGCQCKGWLDGASPAKKEHTLRAPDRYITFSREGERGEMERLSTRQKESAAEEEEDGRLDGRQLESVRRGYANAAIPYPKTVSQSQSVEGAQISVSASERPGASQSHSS